MTKTTAWPFGTDADRDDPLTGLRIPVVNSFNPGWRYVAAYLKPAGEDVPDYLKGAPFASAERPTDAEAEMLASFIQEYIQHWFRESYQHKLAGRALDVDSGCKTIVFIKYGADDWGYRVTEWQYGPTFVPPHPAHRERYPQETGGGPLTLEQVMDRKHTIVDDVLPRWLDWKASHPNTFAA